MDKTRLQLLLVEDNATDVLLLEMALEDVPQWQNELTRVARLDEAMDRLAAGRYDAVLLDLGLPDSQGLKTFNTVQRRYAELPILVLSGLDDETVAIKAVHDGAQDYLVKGRINGPMLARTICYAIERKQMEAALRRSHDELEIRVAERTAELLGSYHRLQASEKLRDDLAHMIVHDLRTPLTSIMMGIETLGELGELTWEQQEVVGMALRGTRVLRGLINDVLDVDKMESGALQIEFAELGASELVASAISQVATLIDGYELTLKREFEPGLPVCFGNADLLRRTLVNLLGNAIKFTPTGGTLTVAVRQADDVAGLRFSVTDTGPGIPAESLGRIFEKFGQVGDTKKLGTGLGLTFCKLAVEAHGGHIAVHSEPGQGSEFYFTIPRQAA